MSDIAPGVQPPKLSLLVIAVAACSHTSAPAEPAPSAQIPDPAIAPGAPASVAFNAFVDTEWDWLMQSFPEMATSYGDLRYNAKLTDWSAEAVAARKAHFADSLTKLRTFDRASLDPRTQVTYDVLKFDIEDQVELAKFPNEYIQLTHMGGIHTAMADMTGYAPKRTVQQVEDFIARLEAAPVQIDQAIALMRQGVEAGITPPKATLTNLPKLARSQMPSDVRKSPVYTDYFADLPAELANRGALQNRGADVLAKTVYPAYERLAAFLEKDYVPRSRTTIGWTEVPNGAAWYQAKIQDQTTLKLAPDEIHAIGLAEVERIGKEMERIKTATGFKGAMPAFFEMLRSDKRFFYTDAADLVRGYRDIAKRIDVELPNVFGKLPRNPYGVKPVPAFAEQVQTTAYYMPGSVAAGRAGVFFCNTYNLKARPKWEMESLTMHEAVPGHHLQMSLAEEVENVPVYRKYAFNNAFIEGWGLYSESLGERVGLYKDPYAKFGQLTYEMWRAVRLVVDTGMHAKGWTRDQALTYFETHAGKAKHDIAIEVDRYLAWPAQALGYKLGQLKFTALRNQAQERLGDRFDIRAFHDVVLGEGTLPLTVLEARVTSWIEAQR